jgi:hypothetical protein
MRRIPWIKLKRRLRSLRTRHHTRKGERLAALSKAEQIMREIREQRQ